MLCCTFVITKGCFFHDFASVFDVLSFVYFQFTDLGNILTTSTRNFKSLFVNSFYSFLLFIFLYSSNDSIITIVIMRVFARNDSLWIETCYICFETSYLYPLQVNVPFLHIENWYTSTLIHNFWNSLRDTVAIEELLIYLFIYS